MVQFTQAATQQLYAALLSLFRVTPTDERSEERDRGAVSLEQVLWFVAVGVSVVVVATILWTRITDQANDADNIDLPEAPNP